MSRIPTDGLVRLGGLLLIAVFAATGGVAFASNQTDAASAGTTKILARRIVVNGSNNSVPLLTIPGLGELFGDCWAGTDYAYIEWKNTSGAPIDVWSDCAGGDGKTRGRIWQPSNQYVVVASWNSETHVQMGTHLELGQGNSPGPRRTATIALNLYRGGTNARCGFQATATTWKS